MSIASDFQYSCMTVVIKIDKERATTEKNEEHVLAEESFLLLHKNLRRVPVAS